MKTIRIPTTPDEIYCPVTGQRIVGPFDGNCEGHGSWCDPACSSHLLFLWDNTSGEFTYCADKASERMDQALELLQAENGEADEQEALDRMIETREAEEDAALLLVIGEDGGLLIAFDLENKAA